MGMQEGFLTPYEEAAYRGRKKTDVDRRADDFIMRSAVRACLGSETSPKRLPDGTEVAITVAEELAAATIRDAIENPDSRKLKDLAAVAGESKSSIDVSVRSMEDLFGDIANPDPGAKDAG